MLDERGVSESQAAFARVFLDLVALFLSEERLAASLQESGGPEDGVDTLDPIIETTSRVPVVSEGGRADSVSVACCPFLGRQSLAPPAGRGRFPFRIREGSIIRRRHMEEHT